jgi:hypothetical protein
MKVKNIGGYNYTYTRTKKMTTKDETLDVHLYKNKEDGHKKMGLWMFTNSEMHTSFLDSARYAAWSSIKELGERLKWRLHNTQQDLKEQKEDTTVLKETISQLQGDMEKLVSELSVPRC